MPTTFSLASLSALAGQELAVSDWFTIDQARITSFGEITGDTQWIHCDPERAAVESPFKTTIAHGFLTLSLIPHLVEQTLHFEGARLALNYGLNRVRFVTPVPAGSRIRGRFAMAQVKSLDNGLDLTLNCTVELDGADKPACVAEWILRVLV
ncbi:MaoC family dehydratase [Chloracidobacterium sp. D]|jgi:acyl dehydratase|uniref:MaoC family dehydratase n=1 Tax=Chloracidobacterium sp. D TaxID=2821536 RepID=UPI001B8CDBA9|nr:MaoC family dehydratase [Chloracidobacterium sp. D]QUV83040.1 MaoC family dehydratase [Chloracidobacterium sp. D]